MTENATPEYPADGTPVDDAPEPVAPESPEYVDTPVQDDEAEAVADAPDAD